MWQYILRRFLYAIPVLLGVNILTFMLFFVVNSPDDIAAMQLGTKHVNTQMREAWKVEHGYDLPLFYNAKKHSITETIFWQKSIKLFMFDFGMSDGGRDIKQAIYERYGPSLAIAIPTLILGLLVNICLALFLALFRATTIDHVAVVICVMLMSLSVLFYIVGGQFVFSRLFKWLPVSGYTEGFFSIKFILLPVMVSVLAGIGSGVRWYRSIFLQEIDQDYVRTAYAKGLNNRVVLFKHVLRNALIPILTGVVVILPLLFLGSLLTESFFGIPGLGSYTIDAIRNQDFAIVRAMVFLGSVLYILGLLLTDISYVLVDPRIKLN